MMKTAIWRLQLAICFALTAPLLAGQAYASLIGDRVYAEWRFQTIDSPPPFGTVTTIVGPGNLMYPGGGLIVEVGADNILVDVSPGNFGCAPPCEFAGLVVYDLDWVGLPTWEISQVALDTNFAGFTPDRLTFGPHLVAFDFNNLICPIINCSEVYLNARLTFVPEPSSLLLLATGGALLMLVGSKARKRSI